MMNLLDEHTTLETIQLELRLHPSRLEERDVCGNTPLMSTTDVSVVDFLLSLGANIEAHNEVLTVYI